jgi:hypothetical protein
MLLVHIFGNAAAASPHPGKPRARAGLAVQFEFKSTWKVS